MRIAIIGFGFSGLMVAANVLRNAARPLTLYIVDEKADMRGVAYATDNPDHLLNVRAGNMSAWVDDQNHLIHWLANDAGNYACVARGLRTEYTTTDFIPRALYGDYLADIWREAQEIAAQKNCRLQLVPSRVVAIQNGNAPAILTARGDAIATDATVLAVGHEMRPVLPHLKSLQVLQNPWEPAIFSEAKNWLSPVVMIGTGLTAIDVLLSLRRAGYCGEVVLASRRGLLPQQHAPASTIFHFAAEEIAAQKSLRHMLRLLRTKIREAGDWRVVVDALRPHTQTIWQRFTTREQLRFQRLLAPLWNVHRHRMAPEIAARVAQEIAAKKLTILCSQLFEAGEGRKMTIRTAHETLTLNPGAILNCTGFELNLEKSGDPLLQQLVANQLVEPHATKLGIAADPHYRAWGRMHPKLYVVGSLLTGQLLESTAVPELRAQAAAVAKALTS